MRPEELGELRARHGVGQRDTPVEAEVADEPLELDAVGALVVGERRPVDVQARLRTSATARSTVSSPFARE